MSSPDTPPTDPTGEVVRRAALGVIMPGFDGTEVPDWLHAPLRDGLGGVCLFAVNTPDPVTTRRLTDRLRELGPQACITVDEEGGDVTRLQRVRGSDLPGNAALGAIDDVELTARVGAATGRLVRAAGIDVTLAPCVDIASNPHNAVIGTRSFGPDADLVARHAVAWLEGLHSAGVGGCAKHFPGHGDTAVDSHVGLPAIEIDEATLTGRELLPFAALVAAGVEAIMPGHIVVPRLGPDPASLSRWAHDRLRGLGFAGPTITDALEMGAIHGQHGIGEAVVRALVAGADLCCLGSPMNSDQAAALSESVRAVEAAVADGRLSLHRLQASASRVRAMVGDIHRRWLATPDPQPATVEHDLPALGLEVARHAVTVTGDVVTGPDPVVVDLRRTVNQAVARFSSGVVDALTHARARDGLGEVETAEVTALPPGRAIVAITRDPLTEPWDDLLAARPDAVVVHVGMAQSAPAAARRVLCHGGGRSNARAAVERLLGQEVAW
ncbi:glycoside hydrolase family 3 protein [Aestuariimicrobium soli]|uniref:glycoside hydrolase family 3 protein n=1 Tax=Aestuariimicrobium soli TaxID=2035834 RepID=UPI003EB6AC92